MSVCKNIHLNFFRYNKQAPQLNSFSHCIASDKITSMISERIKIRLTTWRNCNQMQENGMTYLSFLI